jgi:hypothetical protein
MSACPFESNTAGPWQMPRFVWTPVDPEDWSLTVRAGNVHVCTVVPIRLAGESQRRGTEPQTQRE